MACYIHTPDCCNSVNCNAMAKITGRYLRHTLTDKIYIYLHHEQDKKICALGKIIVHPVFESEPDNVKGAMKAILKGFKYALGNSGPRKIISTDKLEIIGFIN